MPLTLRVERDGLAAQQVEVFRPVDVSNRDDERSEGPRGALVAHGDGLPPRGGSGVGSWCRCGVRGEGN